MNYRNLLASIVEYSGMASFSAGASLFILKYTHYAPNIENISPLEVATLIGAGALTVALGGKIRPNNVSSLEENITE